MQRIQQEETRRRNRAGGYWIAEADPGAAVRRWPRSKASDGQALIVVRFGPDPRSAVGLRMMRDVVVSVDG